MEKKTRKKFGDTRSKLQEKNDKQATEKTTTRKFSKNGEISKKTIAYKRQFKINKKNKNSTEFKGKIKKNGPNFKNCVQKLLKNFPKIQRESEAKLLV